MAPPCVSLHSQLLKSDHPCYFIVPSGCALLVHGGAGVRHVPQLARLCTQALGH